MISVEEARDRILHGLQPLPAETVGLSEAMGRVLAEDVAARVSHPPTAISAMDGYAVWAEDVAVAPVTLPVIGEAAAGRAYANSLPPGKCLRIFTGAPIPDGANAIVIQENTTRDGEGEVTILNSVTPGTFIRPAGLDFHEGQVLLEAGKLLTARDIGLLAAMNIPWLRVRRRPRVAILSTGDEIVMPGEPLAANQIVGSNGPALAAIVTALGGEAIQLGIARDTMESLKVMAAGARGCDLLVTTGGASEGDHDLVRAALSESGLNVDFYKVAMRPGKPLMFGSLSDVRVLGLPGNPVSTVVCSVVFLIPALRALQGLPPVEPTVTAYITTDLRANDRRQEHMRAIMAYTEDGRIAVTPFDKQDSAMLWRLSQADCLVIRPPQAPAVPAGSPVRIIPLRGLL